jgi:hypothetical protein
VRGVAVPTADDVVIPALLRAARVSYARAIAAHVVAAGFDDLPRNGAFVLGGMANRGGSAADVIRGLGISKQATSQLIDALVLRGYLTREINPEDRRPMLIGLTDRGRSAAVAARAGIEEIDAPRRSHRPNWPGSGPDSSHSGRSRSTSGTRTAPTKRSWSHE